jgi:predicted Zn-dependent protease
MTQAGFEAQGFVSMFDKLQQASRLNDNGAYPYLRSHPLTTERIADMQARQPLGPTAAIISAPTMEHAMVSVRARVLSNPGVDALRAIGDEVRGTQWVTLSASRQASVLYGAALASSRLREFSQAQEYLVRLSELVRSDMPAARLSRLLEIEVALASGNVQRAAAVLDGLAPGISVSEGVSLTQRRTELFLRAQLAAQAGATGHASRAAQELQIWVLAHPRDAQAWQLMSSVYSVQGQTLRAIRADAEAQVARLDYAAALDRFKAAQELTRKGNLGDAGKATQDHIESSIIDTRKRKVELLLKEQSLDR